MSSILESSAKKLKEMYNQLNFKKDEEQIDEDNSSYQRKKKPLLEEEPKIMKTFCRLRPPTDGTNNSPFYSISDNNTKLILKYFQPNQKQTTTPPNVSSKQNQKSSDEEIKGTQEVEFKFDKVFNFPTSNEDIYRDVCFKYMENFFTQKKSTLIFAYGLTNSGKTYITTGNDSDPGLMPLCLVHLLNKAKEFNKRIKCSYVEIYNEEVLDLLDENKQKKVQIKENESKNFFLDNCTEIEINEIDDLEKALNEGTNRKMISSTKLNPHSSRSHTIFRVQVETEKDEEPYSFSIVDLAGVERSSKAETKGKEFKETCQINKSLLTLRKCIDAMEHNSFNKFKWIVPIRESSLTKIFKEYFHIGQNIIMFCTINTIKDDTFDNVSVLSYAAKFKRTDPTRSWVVNLVPKTNNKISFLMTPRKEEGKFFSEKKNIHYNDELKKSDEVRSVTLKSYAHNLFQSNSEFQLGDAADNNVTNMSADTSNHPMSDSKIDIETYYMRKKEEQNAKIQFLNKQCEIINGNTNPFQNFLQSISSPVTTNQQQKTVNIFTQSIFNTEINQVKIGNTISVGKGAEEQEKQKNTEHNTDSSNSNTNNDSNNGGIIQGISNAIVKQYEANTRIAQNNNTNLIQGISNIIVQQYSHNTKETDNTSPNDNTHDDTHNTGGGILQGMSNAIVQQYNKQNKEKEKENVGIIRTLSNAIVGNMDNTKGDNSRIDNVKSRHFPITINLSMTKSNNKRLSQPSKYFQPNDNLTLEEASGNHNKTHRLSIQNPTPQIKINLGTKPNQQLSTITEQDQFKDKPLPQLQEGNVDQKEDNQHNQAHKVTQINKEESFDEQSYYTIFNPLGLRHNEVAESVNEIGGRLEIQIQQERKPKEIHTQQMESWYIEAKEKEEPPKLITSVITDFQIEGLQKQTPKFIPSSEITNFQIEGEQKGTPIKLISPEITDFKIEGQEKEFFVMTDKCIKYQIKGKEQRKLALKRDSIRIELLGQENEQQQPEPEEEEMPTTNKENKRETKKNKKRNKTKFKRTEEIKEESEEEEEKYKREREEDPEEASDNEEERKPKGKSKKIRNTSQNNKKGKTKKRAVEPSTNFSNLEEEEEVIDKPKKRKAKEVEELIREEEDKYEEDQEEENITQTKKKKRKTKKTKKIEEDIEDEDDKENDSEDYKKQKAKKSRKSLKKAWIEAQPEEESSEEENQRKKKTKGRKTKKQY